MPRWCLRRLEQSLVGASRSPSGAIRLLQGAHFARRQRRWLALCPMERLRVLQLREANKARIRFAWRRLRSLQQSEQEPHRQ